MTRDCKPFTLPTQCNSPHLLNLVGDEMSINIGDVFSRLTVIAKAEDRVSPSGKVRKYWLCECSCDRNKTIEVRTDILKGSRVRSCGCLRDETSSLLRKGKPPVKVRSLPSLIGQVFGRLVVVAPSERTITPKGRELPRWICSCKCGNDNFIAYHDSLKAGATVSCGCVPPEFVDSDLMNKSEVFAFKAKEVHGDKYDYSLVDFKRSNKKVSIVCVEHGSFEQIPSNHLTGYGCPSCSNDKRAHNLDSFISKSKILHSDTYNYSKVEFTNSNEVVTIGCKKHGDFEQKVKYHLSKSGGCPVCLKESTIARRQEEFIRRALEKHGDRYDYSNVIYEDSRIPVKIGCPDHGEFLQKVGIHMTGSKCPKCSSEERALKQHWDYLERCKLDHNLANSHAVLYLLKLDHEHESFIKVGISSSFNRRLGHYKEEGLTFEVLKVVNTTAIKAALLEREALKYIRENGIRYIPNKVFAGWTECATLESKNQLLEFLRSFNE